MSLIINVGRWGNVYFYKGFGFRLCLGWIAFTFLPIDTDVVFDKVLKEGWPKND